MVETNNGEERIARVEQMVEALQRADAARKRRAAAMNIVTGGLLLANVASLLSNRTSRKD